jgi:hypothetical protein
MPARLLFQGSITVGFITTGNIPFVGKMTKENVNFNEPNLTDIIFFLYRLS